MASFSPYFEKQLKLTARADHPNSVSKEAAKYPCFNDADVEHYHTYAKHLGIDNKGSMLIRVGSS